MEERSLVSVIDDDESVRGSLPDLLREFGYATRAFSSSEEFLSSDCIGKTRCLLLDVTMPGMSGPDLQGELAQRQERVPIIFITGGQDETLRRRLLELGAVECLFKPLNDKVLQKSLQAAIGAS